MAEGVFRSLASSHPLVGDIDSSGTAAYHAGEMPDPRTMNTLTRNGITDYVHYAQKVNDEHFLKYDYLIAMDEWNLRDLLRKRGLVKNTSSASRENKLAEVRLFGDFLPGGRLHERVGGGPVVEDPYYGGRFV